MRNFYVTFPQRLPTKNHYTKVVAENESEARRKTFERYGPAWAFMYGEEEFLPQIERFNLTLLEVL